MSTITRSGALASREEAPAPLSTSASEGNNSILSCLPDVLTLEQVAEVLQISVTGARQMCRERTLPSFKVGQQWRVPRAWLIQFINEGGR
jgi:excisionase family DNA binding protein